MSKGIKKIDISSLRDRVDYQPDIGSLLWKPAHPRHFSDGKYNCSRRCRTWNAKHAGRPAFTTIVKGYPAGMIAGVTLYAHRVAWAIFYGEWPDEIDHINGDTADYRITNLRACTRSQNAANKAERIGSSHWRGVTYRASSGRFIAQIKVHQKSKHLGSFLNETDAARAYDAAAKEHFGEFANLNFPDQ